MIGIYKITNLVNGKCYIGQSIHIEKRWREHKNLAFNNKEHSYGYPLYRAIRKYGIDNFKFEILEECEQKELNEKEIYYIEKYNSFKKGYNQDAGGGFVSQYLKLSDDLVSKIINRLKTSKDNSDIIGNEFGLSGRTVRDINNGISFFRHSEHYPIRKSLIEPAKKYFCKNCGREISRGSEYCTKCYLIFKEKINRPNPLDLAKTIKDLGFAGTGRVFGVDGNTIKKWCKAYDIPYLKNELIAWYSQK